MCLYQHKHVCLMKATVTQWIRAWGFMAHGCAVPASPSSRPSVKNTCSERNAAKLLFGPLEATHEEALAYYMRANELRTEKRVLIKLAETHLALSQRGDAKAWAERAAELPSKPGGAEDDLDAKIAAVLGAC